MSGLAHELIRQVLDADTGDDSFDQASTILEWLREHGLVIATRFTAKEKVVVEVELAHPKNASLVWEWRK